MSNATTPAKQRTNNNNNTEAVQQGSPGIKSPHGPSPSKIHPDLAEAYQTLNMERIQFLSNLFARAPELSLEESTHIRQVFHEAQGERENVTSPLELRILLGRLGIYPEEEEMILLLDVYHNRVSYTAICQYMRFYKKEFQLRDKMQSEEEQSGKKEGGGKGKGGDWQAFSGLSQLGDADTLKAFVALGGRDDGTGTISSEALIQTIQKFNLTIDMEGMIAAVDTHRTGELDYRDFCAMWTLPEEQIRRGSVDSFSSLNPASSEVSAPPRVTAQQQQLPTTSTSPAADKQTWNASRQGSEMRPQMALNRRQLLTQIASSSRRQSTRATLLPESVTPVAGGKYRNQTLHNTTMESKGGVEEDTRNEFNTPITEEEHLLLLKLYFQPELRQQLVQKEQRKTRFAENTHNNNNNTNNNSRRASRDRRMINMADSMQGTKGKLATSKKEESTEQYLAQRQGGYQPPDPMILSMRHTTSRPKTGANNNNNKFASTALPGGGKNASTTSGRGNVKSSTM